MHVGTSFRGAGGHRHGAAGTRADILRDKATRSLPASAAHAQHAARMSAGYTSRSTKALPWPGATYLGRAKKDSQ